MPIVIKRKPPITRVFSLKKARKLKLQEWKFVIKNKDKPKQELLSDAYHFIDNIDDKIKQKATTYQIVKQEGIV